jgi:hypothetical protein
MFVTLQNTNRTGFVKNVSQFTLEGNREKKDIMTALKRQLKIVMNPVSTMIGAAKICKGEI